MRKTSVVLMSATLLLSLTCLSACGEELQGSGSQEGSSAEQLAIHGEDPWTQEWTPQQSATTASGNYRDGVYSGEGDGMDGKVYVTIQIASNHITVLSMDQDGETQSVGGYEGIRYGVFAAQIEAAQGTGIDGISGATVTTSGVKAALQSALDQAAN